MIAKIDPKINSFIVLFFILTVFSVLTLVSLTKFPTVFGDEVEIINMGYKMVNSKAFSLTVFSSQLPPPGEYFAVSYPPLYFLILAIPLKIFGFGIYTLRLTSFFIGFSTLILLFIVSRKVLESDRLALLAVFLMAVDYSFIRASRFGSTHILAVLFFILTALFYVRTFQNPNAKNFLLSGLFSGLSFFSHFIIGLTAPILVTMHYLITGRFKKFGFKKLYLLTSFPMLFFIVWLLSIVIPICLRVPNAIEYALSHGVNNKLTFEGWKHFVTAYKGFTLHVAYEQAIFYIYLIMSSFFLFASKDRSGIKSFMILTYAFIYPYAIYMDSLFYSVFFTAIACVAFPFLLKEKIKTKPIITTLFIIVVICNITSQARIIRKHFRHSYTKYSQEIANNLPKDSKVLLLRLDPEPYFYLAEHRKDLRIERGLFMDIDNKRLISSLDQADFIVTSEKIYNVYKKIIEYNDHSSYRELDTRDQILVNFVIKYITSFISLDSIDVVIFKMV